MALENGSSNGGSILSPSRHDGHGNYVAPKSRYQQNGNGMSNGAGQRVDGFYAADVFNERVMRQRLPKDIFSA